MNAPPQGEQPAPTPPDTGSPPTDAAPALTEKLARRYVVRALTKRLHRRPRTVRQACRRLSATRFRCRVRGRYLTYRFSGSVEIFTIRVPNGFEPRASLRVRRTNTRCTPGRRCSRTLTARNIRF